MAALTNEDFQSQIDASKKATAAFQAQLDARKAKGSAKAKQEAEDVRIASIVLAAMSKIPVPKDGKDGINAEEVDYNVIQDFVQTTVDAIPRPKDGINGADGKPGYTPIKGKDYTDGAPGKDADHDAIVDSVIKHVTTKVDGIHNDLLTTITNDDSFRGHTGPKGEPGESVKGDTGAMGPKGDVGPSGAPGESIKGDKGEPGESIIGPKGDNGYTPIKGIDYHDGEAGKPGKDGKSITGKQGARGITGKKGKDGKHGVGIKNIHTEGTALKISLTDGKVKTLVMPGARATGKAAPIAIPEVQNAMRTPVEATGIVATNVRDALVELKGKIVQSSSGNPFNVGTSEAFMFTFNPYDETHDGKFTYDSNGKLISKTIETHSGITLYTVTFSYNGTQLNSKTIYDEVNMDSVQVTYNYDINNKLIGKTHTYIM